MQVRRELLGDDHRAHRRLAIVQLSVILLEHLFNRLSLYLNLRLIVVGIG